MAHYFLNLPSKKLYGDYFRIIKTPISLNMIKKKVPLGEYPKWADFEQAIALIKSNAEEFNDEGSDIIKDARRLNEYFVTRLAEGKAKVGEAPNGTSSGIKLRLNMGAHRAQSPQKTQQEVAAVGPKIRLNVGRQQALPVAVPPPHAPRSSRMASKPPLPPTAAAPVVNGKSGKRANAAAAATAASVARSMTPQKAVSPPSPMVVSPPPPVAPTSLPIGSLAPSSVVAPRTPEKPDSVGTNRSRSPPSDCITVRASPSSQTHSAMSPPVPNSMPPPPQRLSVTPAASTPGPLSLSPAPPLNVPVPVVSQHRQGVYCEEPRYRAEGKGRNPLLPADMHVSANCNVNRVDASSALITNFRLTSAPNVNTEHKFTRDLSPDDAKVTAQFFVHLPPECHTIVITPTLSAHNLAHRPYKLAVEHKVNNNSPRPIAVWTAQQKRKEEPPFEVRLNPGVVNTIECTLVTAALKGGGLPNGVGGWELERFRVFVSLLPN